MSPLQNNILSASISGQLALGIGVRGMRGVDVCPLMKNAGFDWLFIDLEHGPTSIESVFSLCVTALSVGITPTVRLSVKDISLAARCLDGGALGIFVTGVNDPESARDVVAALRYPPKGRRSVGGSYPQLGFSKQSTLQAIQKLDATISIFPMIEDEAGLENAFEIAATPGVDGLLIGLNDLSLSMGIAGQYRHPAIRDAFLRVHNAVSRSQKSFGFGGVNDPKEMADLVRLGAKLLLCGNDIALLGDAARQRAAQARRFETGAAL